jgi:hypothetical protein
MPHLNSTEKAMKKGWARNVSTDSITYKKIRSLSKRARKYFAPLYYIKVPKNEHNKFNVLTRILRNSEFYEEIREKVLPEVLKNKRQNDAVRERVISERPLKKSKKNDDEGELILSEDETNETNEPNEPNETNETVGINYDDKDEKVDTMILPEDETDYDEDEPVSLVNLLGSSSSSLSLVDTPISSSSSSLVDPPISSSSSSLVDHPILSSPPISSSTPISSSSSSLVSSSSSIYDGDNSSVSPPLPVHAITQIPQFPVSIEVIEADVLYINNQIDIYRKIESNEMHTSTISRITSFQSRIQKGVITKVYQDSKDHILYEKKGNVKTYFLECDVTYSIDTLSGDKHMSYHDYTCDEYPNGIKVLYKDKHIICRSLLDISVIYVDDNPVKIAHNGSFIDFVRGYYGIKSNDHIFYFNKFGFFTTIEYPNNYMLSIYNNKKYESISNKYTIKYNEQEIARKIKFKSGVVLERRNGVILHTVPDGVVSNDLEVKEARYTLKNAYTADKRIKYQKY